MIERIDAGPGLAVSGGAYSLTSTIHLCLNRDDDFNNLKKRVETIEKVLCILNPASELHDQYPALKEAYEAYKIIENLIKGNV
jgi:hypothetical protein